MRSGRVPTSPKSSKLDQSEPLSLDETGYQPINQDYYVPNEILKVIGLTSFLISEAFLLVLVRPSWTVSPLV